MGDSPPSNTSGYGMLTGRPAYFNTAAAKKKSALAVQSRYQSVSPKRAEQQQVAVLSPQGPAVAPEKAQHLNNVVAAEVLGMQEQVSLMLDSTQNRMESIFSTSDSIKNEGQAVEEGLQLIEELENDMKQIPEAMMANDKEASIENERPLADTTYPISQKLSSGKDAIRCHHNLFSQFQFKCLGLKDVLARVMDRAEQVAGPELLDQYRKDTALIGFEKSKPVRKRTVQGGDGKRRLSSKLRKDQDLVEAEEKMRQEKLRQDRPAWVK